MKNILSLIAGFLIILQSCSIIRPSDSSPGKAIVVETSMRNADYASMLKNDGWSVNELNTASSVSYLSDEEKNLILAMNLVRTNPKLYAEKYVKPLMGQFKGKQLQQADGSILLTKEGVAPVKELYNELLKTKPLPPLKVSHGLSKAAASHAQYQSRNGQLGHEGQGGMQKRIEKHGKWMETIAENIAYGEQSSHEAILALMIDDGVKGRGHRKNILNPKLKVAGVGIASHPKYKLVHVINYAGGFSD